MRQRDEIVVDRLIGEVDEAALEGPIALEAAPAGQPPVNVIVRAEHRTNPGKDLRLMAFEPAQLGSDQLLIDAVAAAAQEFRLVDLGREFRDFSCGAAVALLNAGPEYAAVLIEKHERGNHAGHADAT